MDIVLTLKLQKEGKIITPKALFKALIKQEVNRLTRWEVFNFIQWDPIKYTNIKIFNLRIVYKIKGKATDTLYKKSRLIIQAYNNNGKEIIFI